MISVKDTVINIKQFSKLIEIDEDRLFNLCTGLEERGYLFNRNESGNIHLTEKDITVVLSFIW